MWEAKRGWGRKDKWPLCRRATQFEMDHYKECWPVGILSNGAALMLICPFDIRDLVLRKREAQKIRPYYYREVILSTSLHQHLYVEAAGLHRMSSSYLRIPYHVMNMNE